MLCVFRVTFHYMIVTSTLCQHSDNAYDSCHSKIDECVSISKKVVVDVMIFLFHHRCVPIQPILLNEIPFNVIFAARTIFDHSFVRCLSRTHFRNCFFLIFPFSFTLFRPCFLIAFHFDSSLCNKVSAMTPQLNMLFGRIV